MIPAATVVSFVRCVLIVLFETHHIVWLTRSCTSLRLYLLFRDFSVISSCLFVDDVTVHTFCNDKIPAMSNSAMHWHYVIQSEKRILLLRQIGSQILTLWAYIYITKLLHFISWDNWSAFASWISLPICVSSLQC